MQIMLARKTLDMNDSQATLAWWCSRDVYTDPWKTKWFSGDVWSRRQLGGAEFPFALHFEIIHILTVEFYSDLSH